MGKVENVIKSEILRLAKREVRAAFRPLRSEFRLMRFKLSKLSKNFVVLDRMAREWSRQDESKKLKLDASLEEAKASRFTPERIRGLRQKLGITQKELAALAGVTMGAVALWEKGKFAPTLNKKAVLVAIRKLRKRDVKKIIAGKSGNQAKGPPKERKRAVGPKRGGLRKAAVPR